MHIYAALIQEYEPRKIVEDTALFERAVSYYITVMPDLSDRPTITDDEMCLWMKQKKKSRLKPHAILKGVCGAWMNSSFDFAMEKNKWPVVFKDNNNNTVDLVTETMVTVWIKYVSHMVRKR